MRSASSVWITSACAFRRCSSDAALDSDVASCSFACVAPWWRCDRFFGFVEVLLQRLDALQQLLLVHFGRGLVSAQPVEPGLQGHVRLRLRAQRGEQLSDEAFAALHDSLEVRRLAEAVLRFLVALFGFLRLLLELRHVLAALVRELAKVLGVLLFFLELGFEARHLLADFVALALEHRLTLDESLDLLVAVSQRGVGRVGARDNVRQLRLEPVFVVALHVDLAVRA